MKPKSILTLAAVLAASSLHAYRESADGAIVVHNETLGSGGFASNGTIEMEAGIGGFSGGNTTRTGGTIALRDGFIGGLFTVVSVAIDTSPTGGTVDEESSVGLAGVATLDDGTTINLAGADLFWQDPGAPLSPVDASTGTTTASAVGSTIDVDVTGTYFVSGTTTVTVLNTDPDNLPTFAGDGIDDAWQQQYNITTAGFDPLNDDDSDNIALILEAFQNFNPDQPEAFGGLDPDNGDYVGPPTAIIVEEGGMNYAAIMFRKGINTSLPFAAERSGDLDPLNFTATGMVEAESSPISIPGDPNTEIRIFRSSTPLPTTGVEFFQLEVNEIPTGE